MYILFTELGFPHKQEAIHYDPIKRINVHHYKLKCDRIAVREHLEPNFYVVGTDHGYIIGFIRYGSLWLFNGHRVGFDNYFGRDKIHVNGENANATVVISYRDHKGNIGKLKEI